MWLLCPHHRAPGNSEAPLVPSSWRWVRCDDGHEVAAHGTATVDELAAWARQRLPCWLVVPTAWLSWHRVNLPAGRAARSAAALAGLLEERVLEDCAELHLALDPAALHTRAASEAWVAALRADQLRASVEALLTQGWRVLGVLPETAPAPNWSVWAHGGSDGLLRTIMGPEGVLTLPARGLDLAVVGVDPCQGESAWAEPAVFGDVTALWPDLEWRMAPPARLWLQQREAGWNLAQHEWARRLGQGWWQRVQQAAIGWWHDPRGRPLRWGLVANVVLPVLALPLLAAQYAVQEHGLQRELHRVARAALPNVPVLLDPVRQVEQALQRERARTGQLPPHVLEQVLHTWADVGSDAPLRALRWDGHQLELESAGAVPARALGQRLSSGRVRVEAEGQRVRVVTTGSPTPPRSQP